MASSSSNKSCIGCKDSSSDSLMNGWKFISGKHAQLCRNCYSLYKAGQFCETFHADEEGWRDCKSCTKLIHCGCAVSLSDYLLHDCGGIICMECSRTDILLADHCVSNESNVQDLETQSAPESVVNLLFEKLMTPTDSSYTNSRIIIPKKLAKAYFPHVSNGKVCKLKILDTDGNDWDSFYRCWVYGKNKIYVIQGLKDYMVLNKVKAGDTVAFYRRESDGKMIIDIKKTSAKKTNL